MLSDEIQANVPLPPINFRALPGQPRLLWDPKAHEAVEEFCRFYLLSSRDGRGSDLLETVTECFRKIGIHGATYHIVYGPMDLLIRVWLSEPKRMAFLRGIQQPELDLRLDQFVEFKADSVRYLNCGITQATESVNSTQIIKLVQAFREAEGIPNTKLYELIDDALTKRVLHTYISPEGCKIYLFIYGAEGRSLRPDDENRIGIELQNVGASQVTIYSGRGFCAGIVKLICAQYRDTLKIVEHIQATLAQRELFCWSLVPPNRDSTLEGETLHLVESEADSLKTLLMTDLEDPKLPDSYKQEYGMSIYATLQNNEVRHHIRAVINKADQMLIGNRAKQRFNSILCSILARDRRSINKRLSFLISIESNLRSFLSALAKNHPSLSNEKKWPDISKHPLNARSTSEHFEILPSTDTDGRQKFLKSRDLPALIAYIDKFIESGIINLGERGKPLKDCVLHANSIQELRDKYAHGVILDLALREDFQDEMWEILDELITAIRIQIALENLIIESDWRL